ncbi:MAG: hdig domain protein, partial [Pelagibacteraceae bacterium]|nr:hdig domain protein [Pelagibacteraceae bacterium]
MEKNIVSKLLHLLEKKGSNIQYGNEDVTQLEHALQCAELAEINNFSKEIITAALLHDI